MHAQAEVGLPGGDRVRVALHGAHALSWVSGGRERLYLSPCATLDGSAPIRGGVPVCFPQFNQRGPLADRLPKHGMVRNLPWAVVSASAVAERWPGLAVELPADVAEADVRHVHLALEGSPSTWAVWPHAFAALLTVSLWPGALQVTLHLQNTGAEPWAFTGALHTYLAVDDIDRVVLSGLGGQPEWDALADTHATAAPTLRFAAPVRDETDLGFDRVYTRPEDEGQPAPLWLQDGPSSLRIDHSPGWPDVVVWNPGVRHSAALNDLPDDGWRHMLCVEAARVYQPHTVQPGAVWQGWQRLTVHDAAPPVAHF